MIDGYIQNTTERVVVDDIQLYNSIEYSSRPPSVLVLL